jgi:dihydrofolate synthase/folylpolyglutamate synthase
MFGLKKYGRGIGLHRIYKFCDERHIDLQHISNISIVVTGSKGKGSTARFIYSALCDSLGNAGCFTSPHLIDVTERYEFNGQRIDFKQFEAYKNEVLAYSGQLEQTGDSLGEFELLFLVALRWYNDICPRAIVWEAGIGGRYDPARTLGAAISVLTSVEREHTELLGDSIELIAFDKVDAVRPWGRVLVSPSVPEELRQRLAAYGRASGKNIDFVSDKVALRHIQTSVSGTQFSIVEQEGDVCHVEIPLIGAHQARNAATALLAAQAFTNRHAKVIPLDRLARSLKNIKWPGRLERISDVPDVWIDVGHTPESVRIVCDEFLRLYTRHNAIAVLGISENKSVQEIASIVGERFDSIVLASANKNGLGIDSLFKLFEGRTSVVCGDPDMVKLTHQMRDMLAATHRTALVVGGLFLAVEFTYAWQGNDPKTLDFF